MGKNEIPEFNPSKPFVEAVLNNARGDIISTMKEIFIFFSINAAYYSRHPDYNGRMEIVSVNGMLPIEYIFAFKEIYGLSEDEKIHKILYSDFVAYIGSGIEFIWGKMLIENGEIVQYVNCDYDINEIIHLNHGDIELIGQKITKNEIPEFMPSEPLVDAILNSLLEYVITKIKEINSSL
jgi:hypothetical protein